MSKQTSETKETMSLMSRIVSPLTEVSSGARELHRCLVRQDWPAAYDLRLPDYDKSGTSTALNYFARNLVKKYPFSGIDRKAVALAGWDQSEEQCLHSNIRLFSHWNSKDPGNPVRKKIFFLRRKILSVLGPFSWSEAEKSFAWGPGATIRLRNSEGDTYFKFSGIPETTVENLPAARWTIASIPLWFYSKQADNVVHLAAGEKVTTVPKSAKTDRCIGIQPSMNLYIQKGIGTMIRRRLRRYNVDLDNQSLNQNLAKLAYSQALATLDLKAASDSLSSAVVDLLIPDDWQTAMKHCRCAKATLPSGRVVRLQKFSAMGNGFTFELESLIFWALAQLSIHETQSRDVTCGVYGDDLIVSRDVAPALIENLELFGFSVNQDKSFLSGPFFESCGKHYLRGHDITPVFVKAPVATPDRKAWFANSICRWAGRILSIPNDYHTCAAVTACWFRAAEAVPLNYRRLPIPDGVGDGGLVVPEMSGWFSWTPRRAQKGPHVAYQRGFTFDTWRDDKIDLSSRDPSDVPFLLSRLYRLENRVQSEWEPSSGLIQVRKWVKGRGWVSSWSRPSFIAESGIWL